MEKKRINQNSFVRDKNHTLLKTLSDSLVLEKLVAKVLLVEEASYAANSGRL